MAEVLDVLLHGVLVGQVVDLGGDRTIFTLNDAYAGDSGRATLSLGFKTASGGITLKPKARRNKIDPFFSNMLPEGRLRDYVAERNGVHPSREFQLLKILGQDLPGAVVVRPNRDESDVDDRVAKTKDPITEDAPLKFSLAGVQMKLSAMRTAAGGLTVPGSGLGGDWILKFPSERFAAVPENEFWMMTFARRLGFDVPDMDLVPVSSIQGMPRGVRTDLGDVFVIRRFDRTSDRGRVHMEDFAQIFRVYPEDKYAKGNFDMIARVLWAEIGEDGIKDFLERMVLNAAIGNGDMHLKNWTLIYPDGRTPKLAPLYDILSTLTYVGQEDLGLNFAGTKRFHDLTEERFAEFIDKAKLPPATAMRSVKDMARRIRDVWSDFRPEIDLPRDLLDAIDEHMKAVPIISNA